MKKIAVTTVLAVTLIFAVSLMSQDFTYVGAAKCKMCHKSEKQGQQYPLWESRKHSKSIAALSTEEGKALAADAIDNPKCLKCHAPLFEKAPELKSEGVTCEACHGPGSAYKKMSVMKDHAESVKNGLVDYGSTDVIKAQCLTCHASAHDKPFDFASSWEKVKHPIPEKE
ncbi:MAG: cytochrome C554 [Candidatus Aminicenantes bacterium]|nr:cytochrome C554 [Candidatus Aminicenantes bacterium]